MTVIILLENLLTTKSQLRRDNIAETTRFSAKGFCHERQNYKNRPNCQLKDWRTQFRNTNRNITPYHMQNDHL